MKEKLEAFQELVVRKTLEERNNLKSSKEEVDKKNKEILETMLFGVTLIFGVTWGFSAITDFFASSGISYLRLAYCIIAILAAVTFFFVRFFGKKCTTVIVYVVNSGAFVYAFIVSAFIAPDQVTVTFILVLFMVSTLYLDYGWRIHVFMLIATVAFVIAISFFKDPAVINVEIFNSLIVLFLLYVIGTIVRDARLGIIVAKNTMHKYAYYDQLTNVYNRRKLFEDFAKFENNKNVGKITAIGILDVDYFKLYNDTYGHQDGDETLKKIGETIVRMTENYTIGCYRYGGEEFVITFVDLTEVDIEACISEILENIRNLNVPHTGSPYKKITASAGIANLGHKENLQFVKGLTIADKSLYKAKESGRNTYIIENWSEENFEEDLATIRKRGGKE